jgi:hypothetical protein
MAPLAGVLHMMALLLVPLALTTGACADAEVDWLVATPGTTSAVTETPTTLTLSNGLTSRVFALAPVRWNVDPSMPSQLGPSIAQRCWM